MYSVPKTFEKTGEIQGNLAEQEVFQRLHHLKYAKTKLEGLWMIFFHGASYAGLSFRNKREGKLIIREHDFVIFAKYNGKSRLNGKKNLTILVKGKNYIILAEVKSTKDQNSNLTFLEKTSDAKVIKNNKRSAQHQLRDHLEVLERTFNETNGNLLQNVQCYIMWPFLGGNTKDPNQKIIKRWKEDNDLHVFQDTIEAQDRFDDWFYQIVLTSNDIQEIQFLLLLNR